MSKKHKKKHAISRQEQLENLYRFTGEKSKKDLNKEFNKAIREIEYMQMQIFEADKRDKKKSKRAINKRERDFYTEVNGIRCRKNIAKKWNKSGFLDWIIELLKETSPLIKTIARLLATLIISFLSIESIKKIISPALLNKLAIIFDIVQAI